MSARVSAIIPTVGESAHLRAAVESALSECSVDDELLLVHDELAGRGPRPVTEAEDPRVRLIESPRRGVSAARNAGIEEARGRWVAFLDDDDLWLPGHLGTLLEAHAADPECVLVASHPRLFHDHTPGGDAPAPAPDALDPMLPGARPGRIDLTALVRLNPFTPSAVLLDAGRLDAHDRFDETMTHLEDWELWLRLVRRMPARLVDRATVLKRERPGAASRRLRAMAEGGLGALERLRRAGLPSDLDDRALRHREAGLYHDLAYACLIEDGAAARQASLSALRRHPTNLKTLVYWLLSFTPRALRRRAVS